MATHKENYKGNCPPQVHRNLILKYTKEEDVLDSFCGSGTSMIVAKLLKIVPDNAVDFIFAQPSYTDIIKCSKDIKGNLSLLELKEFLNRMKLFSKECFRTLKRDKVCSIWIG